LLERRSSENKKDCTWSYNMEARGMYRILEGKSL